MSRGKHGLVQRYNGAGRRQSALAARWSMSSMKAEFDPNTQCTPSKMAGNRGTMGHLYCVRGPAPQLYHHKWELNSCSFASTSDE